MSEVIRFAPTHRRPRRRRRGQWRPAAAFSWIAIGLITGAGLGLVVLERASPGLESREGAAEIHFTMCSWGVPQNCVIDGDTIRVDGEKIRLADIDTPETHEPRCAAEADRGQRATRRLLELLNDGPIRIVATGGRDRDRYGRALRIVERQGRSVGSILVAEGLARNWDGARRSWCG